MLPWNLFSLAVRNEHLNSSPFKAESPCVPCFSLQSTGTVHCFCIIIELVVTLGVYPVCIIRIISGARILLYGLGRDFSKRKSEPPPQVVKRLPSHSLCRVEMDVTGCASYGSLPGY